MDIGYRVPRVLPVSVGFVDLRVSMVAVVFVESVMSNCSGQP